MSLLSLLLLASGCLLVATAPKCPALPSTCSCNSEDNGRLSITCEGAVLSSLFKDIGTLPLEVLSISNCSQSVLNVLPKGFVRSLKITNCKIKTVDAKVFQKIAGSLEELVLANNSLATVPLFGSLPKLTSLNLNGNLLSDVAEKSLEGLTKLRHLRLEGNQICTLSTNALNETKSTLELLDLSGNCLGAIPAQNLRNSGRLMFLDMSDNRIGEINNFELMNLPKLREIRLNNNQLNNIHPMAFMNVPQLQYLYLRDNLVGNLDGNRLQAFKQLEILDLTNNLLQKLPSLKDLHSLQYVIMDGNLIEKIETLAFSNNPRLKLISLQDNNIAQVSRNSFDSLDQLIILLLSNNSISAIERGMLDGMRNLQQLNIRNNSLVKVDSNTFSSLTQLTTLDMAYNKITRIHKDTFTHQAKLFWLDISNNQISGFEKDTFTHKIANILLDGNPLICDDKFDWFVHYLVSNRVRTFLPFQSEISCAGPEKYAGVRLKDLMIKKANDTISEGMKTLGLDGQGKQRSLLSSFIPGLNGLQGAMSGQSLGGMAAGVPILGTITQAIPSLRNIPGIMPSNQGAQPVPANRNLNSAIEQFTAPLVRFATGGQPVASDIEQLLNSIPNFIVNVPGLGDVDISKLDPNLVAHVLKGGQIPGIPKETLDTIVQQYMTKMHDAAAAAQAGKLAAGQAKYLPPVETLPQQMVTDVLQGNPLPGLDAKQTRVISEYYTKAMQVEDGSSPAGNKPAFSLNPQTLEMLKMLPPGYNLTKIPQEIMTAVSRGEVPDFTKLPQDLLDHFVAHTDKMSTLFNRATAANTSIEEILAKLPKFEKPVLSTFSPYDINELSSEMVHEEEEAKKAAKMRLYTSIALGLVGAITIVILAVFIVYIKRQRQNKSRNSLVGSPSAAAATVMPLANSTMIGNAQNTPVRADHSRRE